MVNGEIDRVSCRLASEDHEQHEKYGQAGALQPPETRAGRHLRALALDTRQAVSELLFLGLQVPPRRVRYGDLERQPFADREPVALDAHQLSRVVAQEAHGLEAELAKHL